MSDSQQIAQLQAYIDQLRTELDQVTRERDQAVAMIEARLPVNTDRMTVDGMTFRRLLDANLGVIEQQVVTSAAQDQEVERNYTARILQATLDGTI
jgi:hypothetical protein